MDVKEVNVREIRSADYNDIYLLNQEFNPKLYLFSAERVKERIDFIIKNTKDIIFVSEHSNEVIGYIHVRLLINGIVNSLTQTGPL